MLLVVTAVVFFSVRLAPGDICAQVLGTAPEPGQCDVIDHELGLNRPAVVQYFHYIAKLSEGDLGTSFYRNQSVGSEIKDRFPLTLELSLMSIAFGVFIGLPLGVWSAIHANQWSDITARVIVIFTMSMPSFWVATFFIVLPALWWRYAPPAGYDPLWSAPLANLEQLVFPAISGGLFAGGALARMTRSSLIEVLRQDYIRTARAKGLSPFTVYSRHALRTALLPVFTLMAVQFAALLGGTVVLESIFGLPGMGALAVQAILLHDYPMVQGTVLLSAIVVLSVNFLIDMSYPLLDPRIKVS